MHVPVQTPVDAQHARHVLRAFAKKLGMPEVSVEEVLLAASELGTNLINHTKSGGELIFSVHMAEDVSGDFMLEVQALDSGPGIGDLDLALKDGFSTRGTLGSGLPAVRRLVDSFTIQTGPDGTSITITKRITGD